MNVEDMIFDFLKPFNSLNHGNPSQHYRRNHIYMIYFIGSPTSADHERQKQANHRYIPVIVSIKDKSSKKIVAFKKITISASLLPFIAIGDNLTIDGKIAPRKYKSSIFTFTNQLASFTYVDASSDKTLDKLFYNGFNVLKVANNAETKHNYPKIFNMLRQEKFLRFPTQSDVFIYIPVVEVVRYFYISCSSLEKVMLSPSGISSLFSSFEYSSEDNTYNLNLEKDTKYADRYNIFYFLKRNEYAEMFNSIFLNWNHLNVFQAPIPFNPPNQAQLNIKADFILLPSGDCMILKIIQSNHLYEELNNERLSIYHPNKNRPSDASQNGKEEVEWHRKKAHINKELDSESKTDKMITPEYLYDSSLDEYNEWDFKINEEKRNGEDFNCKLKVVTHSDDETDIGLSTNEGISRGGNAVRMEIDRENLEITTADPIDLEGLILELVNRGFNVYETDGIFEDRIYTNGVTEGRAQAYADPALSVKRRWKLLTVYNDEQLFYLLDAQEREPDHYSGGDKNTRPGLLVFPDPGSDNFEEEYVKLLIANIVMNGGTWFTRKTRTDKISPIDAIYGHRDKTVSLRHIENPEKFADSVLRAVERLEMKGMDE